MSSNIAKSNGYTNLTQTWVPQKKYTLATNQVNVKEKFGAFSIRAAELVRKTPESVRIRSCSATAGGRRARRMVLLEAGEQSCRGD